MPAVLVTVSDCAIMQNSLHPLSIFSIIARHLLDFMVQEKTTEADAPTICLDATPPPSSPHFMPNALFAATLPVYPVLGRAPNNAVLHTQ